MVLIVISKFKGTLSPYVVISTLSLDIRGPYSRPVWGRLTPCIEAQFPQKGKKKQATNFTDMPESVFAGLSIRDSEVGVLSFRLLSEYFKSISKRQFYDNSNRYF